MNNGYQSPLGTVLSVCLVGGWVSGVLSFTVGPFPPEHPASLVLSSHLVTPHGWVDLTEMGGWSLGVFCRWKEKLCISPLPSSSCATFPDAALVGRFRLDTRENRKMPLESK